MRISRKNRRRLVRCAQHGDIEGFVACLHVLNGTAEVGWIEFPGDSHPTLGTIICVNCTGENGIGVGDVPNESLSLVCGLCARDRGINRVGGKLKPTPEAKQK